MRELLLLAAEVHATNPDVFFNECGSNLSLTLLKWLFPGFKIFSLSPVSPMQVVGAPEGRGRRLTVGYNLETMIAEPSEHEFYHMYSCTVELNVDDFFVAPQSEIDDEIRLLAKQRKWNPELAVKAGVNMKDLYCAGAAKRMEDCRWHCVGSPSR